MGQALRAVVNIDPNPYDDITHIWQMYMHQTEQFNHNILQSLQDQHSEQAQNLYILLKQLFLSKPCAMLQVQVKQGEVMVPDLMRMLVAHYLHAA